MIKLYLEPLSEYFLIPPGDEVVIVAFSKKSIENASFCVGPADGCIIVYAPGAFTNFIDCYVRRGDERLQPDGN